MTAKSGTIGGATIQSDSIRASNGNWWIASNGSASFENVYINGVQNGSYFGSVGYNDGTTWGNFSGSSYFGSNVGSPFGGTCVTHIQSIAADYISVNYLDAMNADIGNLQVKYADIENLVATKADIEQLNAANAQIENLKSSSISVNRLTVDGRQANWRWLNVVTSVGYQRTDVKGVDGNTTRVISNIDTTGVDMYVIVS